MICHERGAKVRRRLSFSRVIEAKRVLKKGGMVRGKACLLKAPDGGTVLAETAFAGETVRSCLS